MDLTKILALSEDKYIFSDTQAQAILEMKLSHLTALEQDKITLDYKDLLNKIKEFQKILNDRSVLMDLIRNELSDIKKNFGDERKTDFERACKFSKEDLTKEEDLVVTLSNAGYVKAQPIHLYTPQKRGGRRQNCSYC